MQSKYHIKSETIEEKNQGIFYVERFLGKPNGIKIDEKVCNLRIIIIFVEPLRFFSFQLIVFKYIMTTSTFIFPLIISLLATAVMLASARTPKTHER
jgi:hypothetical protein